MSHGHTKNNGFGPHKERTNPTNISPSRLG